MIIYKNRSLKAMNNNNLQSRAIVFVGSYTRQNIRKALSHPVISRTHLLIQDWMNYPERNAVYRVELELREKINLGNFVRPADLFDLVRFASSHLELVLQYGPVEGFDLHLDDMGKEIGVPLTIPFVLFSGRKIQVLLDRNDRNPESKYQLVVTEQRML